MIKKKWAYISFVFVTLHFLLIWSYLFPDKYVPDFLNSASKFYVVPVFKQNWSMFAPPPSFDMKLLIKTEEDSSFYDPTERLLKEHNKNRFGKAGRICKIQDKLIREMYYQLEIEEKNDHKNDTLYLEKSLDSLTIHQSIRNFYFNLDSNLKGKVNFIYKSVYPPEFGAVDADYTEHVFILKPFKL